MFNHFYSFFVKYLAVEYLKSKSVTILSFWLKITNQVVDPSIFLEFDSASEKENIRGWGGYNESMLVNQCG